MSSPPDPRPTATPRDVSGTTKDNLPPTMVPGPAQEPFAGAVGDGYHFIAPIGRGGFAEVWRGRAPGDVEVAIKVILRTIDHEESRRDLAALDLIKGVRHAFLLQTHAYWLHSGRLTIAMELADCTLRDRFKDCLAAGEAGVPAAELFRYTREAAEAIDFMHARNILHRDLKPENILLLQGHAKVADFGLARLLQGDDQMQATVTGTPRYMAPEVWHGKVGPRSDQYSLAMSYAELRLGRWPFGGTNMMSVMLDHVESVPDLGSLEDAEKAVLLRALAKAPEERYPSCTAFAEALEEALPETRPTSREVATLPPRPNWRLRAGVAVLLALAALLAVSPWLVRIFSGPDDDPPPAPWLAANMHGADGAKVIDAGGLRLFDKVVVRRGGIEVPFLLIHEGKMEGRVPYYIMVNKVTEEQFCRACDDDDFKGVWQKYADAHPWTVQKRSVHQEPAARTSRLPVRGVTVTEAHCFAEWLGDRLPNVWQWKKAAGYYDDTRAGPFDASARLGTDIAVRRRKEGPMPVDQANGDVSIYGCRHMAGNACEWTRTIREDRDREVPLNNPQQDDWVEVCGRGFWMENPLRFKDLQEQVVQYEKGSEDRGFRIVIEPFVNGDRR